MSKKCSLSLSLSPVCKKVARVLGVILVIGTIFCFTSCDGSPKTPEEPAHQHSFTKVVEGSHFTGDDGKEYHKVKCSGCEETQNQECTFSPYVKKAATCVAPGVQGEKCACGYEKAETTEIAVNDNHSLSSEWSKGSEGHWKTCTVCGKKIESTVAQHQFGEWKTEKDATTTETGSRKRVCKVCEYEETQVIPMVVEEQPHEAK